MRRIETIKVIPAAVPITRTFKVGSHPIEEEKEMARQIAAATAEGGLVWADANQGMPQERAAEFCTRLHAMGVDVIEQPLAADQLHAMRSLRRRTPMRLAVDEASVSASDFSNMFARILWITWSSNSPAAAASAPRWIRSPWPLLPACRFW